jgi:hypothetical protein
MIFRAALRLALVAVALPVAKGVLRKVGRSVQQRHPNSRVGNSLQRAASGLDILSGRR